MSPHSRVKRVPQNAGAQSYQSRQKEPRRRGLNQRGQGKRGQLGADEAASLATMGGGEVALRLSSAVMPDCRVSAMFLSVHLGRIIVVFGGV